ncbi:MAG: hypothetical protein ACI9UU_000010 [Candidatus Azotimanducaceae bacterium]|jgi:hypothetical protein
MKILKIIAIVVAATVVVAAIGYVTRTDPVLILAGKRLSGEESSYPADWSFTNDYPTVFVESRPDDPHSVTTSCWLHEGVLYIPAQSGSTKSWTHYVLEDPRVRIKVGDSVYPARLDRVAQENVSRLITSRVEKYPPPADSDPQDAPKDVWVFRVSDR